MTENKKKSSESRFFADELGAGLKAVCNKMQIAGRIFKTHLKRSDLKVVF